MNAEQKPQGTTRTQSRRWLQRLVRPLSRTNPTVEYIRLWLSLKLRKFGFQCLSLCYRCRIRLLKCRAFRQRLVIRLKCWPHGDDVLAYFSRSRAIQHKFVDDTEMFDECHRSNIYVTFKTDALLGIINER